MTIEEINKLSTSEKIKLYIDHYNNGKVAETKKVSKSSATHKKSTAVSEGEKFKLLLVSGLDVVIENEFGEQFIFMPSQDKYLIKKEKTINNIRDMEKNDFKKFFSTKKFEIKVNGLLIDIITSNNIDSLYGMILKCSEDLKNGAMSLSLFDSRIYTNRYYGYGSIDAYEIFNRVSNEDGLKIRKMLAARTGILTNQNKYGRGFAMTVISLYKNFGMDIARMFAESYTKSSLTSVNADNYSYRYRTKTDELSKAISEYGADPKRLIEYLCFDVYTQGFVSMPINTYMDYLQMAKDVDDGKIKDKYPKYLLTTHDIYSLRYSQMKIEIDKKKFADNYKKFKDKYSVEGNTLFKTKTLEMIIPEKPQDLINEGIALGHCVGSYVEKVAKGDCLILFVRKNLSIDNSYLTVEIAPCNEYGKNNYMILQIQAENKRTTLTTDEINFFKEFMKETGFLASNRNLKKEYAAA